MPRAIHNFFSAENYTARPYCSQCRPL